MAVMAERRKVSYDSKIPGRSIPEVLSRFQIALARQKSLRGKRYLGKKLTAEALTSTLVLHFTSLSEADQDKLIDDCLPMYEALLVMPGEQEEPTMAGAKESPTQGAKKKSKPA